MKRLIAICAFILLLVPVQAFSGFTYTTNLNLSKPDQGEPGSSWGPAINANFDTIDAMFPVAVLWGGTGKTSWTAYALPFIQNDGSFGEIAIGTSGYFLKSTGTGYTWAAGTTAPGGSTTHVQRNLGGAFSGDSGFTYDGSGNATLTGDSTAAAHKSSTADGSRGFRASNTTADPTGLGSSDKGFTQYREDLGYNKIWNGSSWEQGFQSGVTHTAALYTQGDLKGGIVPTDATSTGSVAAKDCYGGGETNTGASAGIVRTLPDAVKGMVCTFVLTAAYDVDINPNGTERILNLTDANGDAISSDATIGSYITLWAVSATQWMPMGATGTWTDVN